MVATSSRARASRTAVCAATLLIVAPAASVSVLRGVLRGRLPFFGARLLRVITPRFLRAAAPSIGRRLNGNGRRCVGTVTLGRVATIVSLLVGDRSGRNDVNLGSNIVRRCRLLRRLLRKGRTHCDRSRCGIVPRRGARSCRCCCRRSSYRSGGSAGRGSRRWSGRGNYSSGGRRRCRRRNGRGSSVCGGGDRSRNGWGF